MKEYPVRKHLPHEVPPWVSDGSFFFVTLNCLPRHQNQLCRAGTGDAVLNAAAFYHQGLRWHCPPDAFDAGSPARNIGLSPST